MQQRFRSWVLHTELQSWCPGALCRKRGAGQWEAGLHELSPESSAFCSCWRLQHGLVSCTLCTKNPGRAGCWQDNHVQSVAIHSPCMNGSLGTHMHLHDVIHFYICVPVLTGWGEVSTSSCIGSNPPLLHCSHMLKAFLNVIKLQVIGRYIAWPKLECSQVQDFFFCLFYFPECIWFFLPHCNLMLAWELPDSTHFIFSW